MRLPFILLVLAWAGCAYYPPPPRMHIYDITEITQAAVAAQLWLENLASCPALPDGKVMRTGNLGLGRLRLVEGAVQLYCATDHESEQRYRYEWCCGRYEADALFLRSQNDEIEIRGPGLPEPLTRRGGLSRCEWDAWFDGGHRREIAVVGSMEDGYLEADLFCVPSGVGTP